MTVAGIGCRRGVSADEVLAAIEAARDGRHLDALATVPGKADEPGLVEAARRLGLPLLVGAVDDGRLATRSTASLAATGVGSASEAAALGAAGPAGRLVGPRRVVGRVTCAVAVGA